MWDSDAGLLVIIQVFIRVFWWETKQNKKVYLSLSLILSFEVHKKKNPSINFEKKMNHTSLASRITLYIELSYFFRPYNRFEDTSPFLRKYSVYSVNRNFVRLQTEGPATWGFYCLKLFLFWIY